MNWKPGERVYRRVWTGLGGAAAFRLELVTVVRLNKHSVTVRTESGSQLKLRGGDIVGPAPEFLPVVAEDLGLRQPEFLLVTSPA